MDTGAYYEIVRVRNFPDHDHGQVTQVDTEITIRGIGKAIDNIVLGSADFLPSLQVTDSSGEEYPLLSNDDIRAILRAGHADDWPGQDAASILSDIDMRRLRLLWIKVPPHKTLKQGEVRILHLKYDHSGGGGGLLSGIRHGLLGSSIVIDVPSGLPFPAFWVLRKLAGYDVVNRRYSRIEGGEQRPMGSWKDNADAIFCKEAENSVQLSVSRGEHGAVLSYVLRPKKSVVVLPVVAVALLSLLSAAVGIGPSVFAGNASLGPVIGELSRHELPPSLFVVASSLVIPRFVDNIHIRNGLLPLYLAPIALTLGFIFL